MLVRAKRLFPDGFWPLIFLLPYLVGFVIFIANPIISAFTGSFTDWSLFGTSRHFVGLENYARLLQDESFRRAFMNTLYYVAALVPGEIIPALLLAVLINRQLRGTTFFRSVFFAPFVMSLASIGMVWSWLYTPDIGLINRILSFLHIAQPNWLNDPSMAMPAVIIASIWRNIGYYMVIFLAGIQSIPQELNEAALIDGAGFWQRLRHITLPLLTPSIFFAVMIGVILGFQVFDITYVMTQGGPAEATTTILYFIYIKGFQGGSLGYAASAAFVLLVIMLLFTVVYFAGQRRWVFYQ